jgi:hypothetical protein
LVETSKFGKKPGFFDLRLIYDNTWLRPANSVKNPVSLIYD